VAYQIALLLLTFRGLDGHFYCLKPFTLLSHIRRKIRNKAYIVYDMFTHVSKSACSL